MVQLLPGMKLFEGSSQLTEKLENPVVTIGNFDGVHLGHQALFKQVIERARAIGGVSVVYTFDPHPLKVLQPHRFFPLITTREEKQGAIAHYGIDVLICEPFNQEFAQLSTEVFVRDILCGDVGAKEIFIGPDYRFGKGRAGTTELLRSLGERCGLTVKVLPNIKVDGVEVRSTLIRNLVREGKVREAERFLGRPYGLKGTVIAGQAIGRTLGIPTANLTPEKDLYPQNGIFAVRVRLDGRDEIGVLNIGNNPTFPGKGFSLEVHILDFDGDLYGRQIELQFIEKLRNERKFESPEQMVRQIGKDIEEARRIVPKR